MATQIQKILADKIGITLLREPLSLPPSTLSKPHVLGLNV